MATMLVRALVSISIFQFIVILQLLIVRRDSFSSSSLDTLSSLSSKEMVRAMYKMEGGVASAANDSSTVTSKGLQQAITKISYMGIMTTKKVEDNNIKGVAVTLFLHSPTWFQRRYTMMIYNILFNLPEGWVIQIFGTGLGQSSAGLAINRGLQRLVDRGVVRLTIIPPEVFNKRRKLVYLMTDPWLWSNMLADKVLVFGGNQVICSNSPYTMEDFLSFDWIGAPWDFGYMRRQEYRGLGGDGGISIRNRRLMLKVIDYETSKVISANRQNDNDRNGESFKNWGQEDQFFMSRIAELVEKKLLSLSDFRIASRNETLRFAANGGAANTDNFAASGILPVLSDDERNQFIMHCPELKLLYPSLHNPACFGAEPDGPKCALSICALRDKTSRRGGC